MRFHPCSHFARGFGLSVSNLELYIGLSISDLMLYTVASASSTIYVVLVARPNPSTFLTDPMFTPRYHRTRQYQPWSSGSGSCRNCQHRKTSGVVRPPRLFLAQDSPLSSPVHDVVCGNEWRDDVEDLCAGPSPRVEDGCVGCAGEGVLSVGGEAVGDDALLGLSRGACETDDAVSKPVVFSIVPRRCSRSFSPPDACFRSGLRARCTLACRRGSASVGLATHQAGPSHRCTYGKVDQHSPRRFTVVLESTNRGRELPKNRKKSRASHLDTMTCCRLTCCTCREGHRRRRCEESESVSLWNLVQLTWGVFNRGVANVLS